MRLPIKLPFLSKTGLAADVLLKIFGKKIAKTYHVPSSSMQIPRGDDKCAPGGTLVNDAPGGTFSYCAPGTV